MATEAQALVGTLLSRGWNNTQIARKFGINPRTIGYAASGEKPASNLVPGLQKLVRSGVVGKDASSIPSITIARRAQRVREAPQRLGTIATMQEKRPIHVSTNSNKAIIQTLETAKREGKQVALTPEFGNVKRKRKSGQKAGRPPRKQDRGDVPMFQKGGYDASRLIDKINNPGAGDTWKPGDARGFIRAEALKMGNVSHVGSLKRVEIHAYNPTP